jgi:flagellar motor protein MotB
MPRPRDTVPTPITLNTPNTFDPGEATFRSSEEETLLKASLIREFNDRLSNKATKQLVERIIIEGHADAVPLRTSRVGMRDNIDLSFHRARLIDSLLIELNKENKWFSQAAMDTMLCPSAFGSRRLKLKTAEAQAENRRIEIVFKFHD